MNNLIVFCKYKFKGVLFKVCSSIFKICVGREGWTRNTFSYAVPLTYA